MLWYPDKYNKQSRRRQNKGLTTYSSKKGFSRPTKFKDVFQTNVKRRNATPKWLTIVHRRDMASISRYAAYLTKKTGLDYQVDHIEPLTSDNSCGLHVPWNLRVVTKLENQQKHNKRIENYVSPWCVFPTPISPLTKKRSSL